MSWFMENLGTIVIGILLLAGVTILLIRLIRSRIKSAKSGCNAGCCGCPYADKCHKRA